MNIDWNKIKKEYPKGFKKFLEDKILIFDGDSLEHGGHIFYGKPASLCYCDIEKFFDDNGIIINIAHNLLYLRYDYMIYSLSLKLDTITGNEYFRQEAKEQAIYKAFEILEDHLKGE